jgi:hypothetical protein
MQKEGLEHEFTAVFVLSIDGHIATSSKDRTGLFDDQYFKSDIQTGRLLKNCLDGNEDMPITSATPSQHFQMPRQRATPMRGAQ